MSAFLRGAVTILAALFLDRYPPDKQEKATQTVLEQAEALSGVWAGE